MISQPGALEYQVKGVKVALAKRRLLDSISVSELTPRLTRLGGRSRELGAGLKDIIAADNMLLTGYQDLHRIKAENKKLRHVTDKQMDGKLPSSLSINVPATKCNEAPAPRALEDTPARRGSPASVVVAERVGEQQAVLAKSCPKISRRHEIEFTDNLPLYEAVYNPEQLLAMMARKPGFAEAIRGKIFYTNKQYLEAVGAPGLTPHDREELVRKFLPRHRY